MAPEHDPPGPTGCRGAPERRTWSRRSFLVALFGFVALSGALAGRELVVRRRRLRAELMERAAREADAAPFDDRLLSTVAVFTGAIFGHDLAEQDHTEIVDRLRYAATMDRYWRVSYALLAAAVDDMARVVGASSFVSASTDQRERVVERVTTISPYSLASRVLALVSEHHDRKRQLRDGTIPHLARVYRTSGVPWRLRGYVRWPGVPGDPTEYSRPGA